MIKYFHNIVVNDFECFPIIKILNVCFIKENKLFYDSDETLNR